MGVCAPAAIDHRNAALEIPFRLAERSARTYVRPADCQLYTFGLERWCAMQAMVFTGPGQPLAQTERAPPLPDEDQILIRVSACAVCRTDLHIVDGELRIRWRRQMRCSTIYAAVLSKVPRSWYLRQRGLVQRSSV